MKLRYCPVFCLFLLFLSCNNNQEITIGDRNPPHTNVWIANTDYGVFTSLCIGDSNTLWMSTYLGSVFSSPDGGGTWNVMKKGNGSAYEYLTKGKDLWAVEDKKIVSSTDNGRTWKVRFNSDKRLTSLYASGITAFATTADGSIIYSENNGLVWTITKYSENALYCITADKNGKNIWAVGNTVLNSRNGGKTWVEQLYKPGLVKQSFTYAYCDSDGKYIWVGDQSGNIFLSENGGNSWKQKSPVGGSLSSLCGDGGKSNLWLISSNTVLNSTDGGDKWNSAGDISEVEHIWVTPKSQNIWGSKTYGGLFRQKFGVQNWADNTFCKFKVKKIYCVDSNTVWSITTDKKILRSIDAGSTWDVIKKDISFGVNNINGDYKENIYVVGDSGKIIQSNDNGVSWTILNIGTNRNLTNISCDEKNLSIVAIGDSGLITSKKSNDTSWSIDYPCGSSTTWNDVKYLNNKFWICGEKGKLVSGNGENKWQQSPISPDVDILKVNNSQDSNSILLATNSKVGNGQLFEFSPGTSSVSKVNTPPIFIVNDFIFSKGAYGNQMWLLGDDGYENNYLYFSFDNGENWYKEDTYGSDLYKVRSSEILFIVNQGSLLMSQPKYFFPFLEKVSVAEINSKVNVRVKLHDYGSNYNTFPSKASLSLFASDSKKKQYLHQQLDFIQWQNDSLTYSCAFDPKAIRLSPGDAYYLKFDLTDSDFTQSYFLPNKFIYDPWQWIKSNEYWLLPLALLILYNVIVLCIWRLYPLMILRIHKRIPFDKAISSLPSPIKEVFSIFFLFFPFSSLAESATVLNAWSRLNYLRINKIFNKSDTVALRKNYVPMPILDETSDFVINEPGPSWATNLSSGKRNIVQIIGDGGLGKTTLAIQIANWIVQKKESEKIYSACVLIESDTTDILKLITSRISAWLPDEKITPDFITALLKNQNILVIIDALSEKSPETQKHINDIFGELQLNLLFITARYRFSFEQQECQIIKPIYLTLDKLFYFINHFMEKKIETSKEKYKDKQSLTIGFNEQLKFVEKIGTLLGNTKTISPILITLIIDNFFEAYYEGGIMDFDLLLKSIPENVPAVYVQYVKSINPQSVSVTNYLPSDNMIEIVKFIAFLCLKDTYTPQGVPMIKTKNILKERYPQFSDPLQRIIDNQIMTKSDDLGMTTVSFNLDPCAENLGALYIFENTPVSELVTLYLTKISLLDDSNGFKKTFLEIATLKKIDMNKKS